MGHVIAQLKFEIERCNIELAAHTDDEYFEYYKASLIKAISILENF